MSPVCQDECQPGFTSKPAWDTRVCFGAKVTALCYLAVPVSRADQVNVVTYKKPARLTRIPVLHCWDPSQPDWPRLARLSFSLDVDFRHTGIPANRANPEKTASLAHVIGPGLIPE